ncbi:SLBB domain-containing protein [Shewanella morhuae]|uniref:Polysialic acid transport protein kpsD n=1 Tax=Shewanella morhuae TaxID=365591 RepID=A0A380A8W3_9GAMM|nr:SLBB domain-containing protein [Shewanella morhuae]SUI75502.1 Polysialic acid transport protein kpsD precursor [Shewanella morhuae]
MLQHVKKNIILVISFAILIGGSAYAATPSPQMIEQFKKLPKSEQTRLAEQYGIDPSRLNSLSDKTDSQSRLYNPNLVNPRIDKDAQDFNLEEKNRITAEVEKYLKDKKDYENSGLKRFGYDLFDGEPTTFAPVTDIPVSSNYIIGPGDTVKVQLYGKENRQYDLLVDRDGSILFPELGPVSVSGLTFTQLRESLALMIKQQMIGVDANVTMGELRSIRIFVAGDAYKPGSYTVSSLSTMTQALFVAGGLNKIGSLRNVQLKRNGKLIGVLDLYDLLLRGDASGDLRLQSGDVVFIPAVGGLVTVDGEVRRPAIYEVKNNETMSDVITMAAGLKEGAYPKASSVERYNNEGLKSFLNVDLTTDKGQKIPIAAGDVINVKGVSNQFENAVTIVGAVVRPGKYQWENGQRISDLLPSLWGDLLASADLDYAIILREINKYGDIEVHQFSLSQAIVNRAVSDDLLLAPRDKIIVFNFSDEDQNRYELNKLVKDRVVTLNDLSDENFKDSDIFKQGFSELTASTSKISAFKNKQELAGIVINETSKEDKQQIATISQEVSKMLASLFDDPALIKLSHAMTRQELLYPVIRKLTVQSRNGNEAQIVSVNGQVRYPSIYPLAINGDIRDLVAAAGGLKEGAYLVRAELTRTLNNNDGSTVSHQNIELAQALSHNASDNMLLMSRDILTVMTIPDWQEHQSVEVRGEVKFPGTYNIRRGETLEAVIERAGGYTDYAYLPSAVFVRESVRKQEQLEIRKLADQLRREIATRGVSKDGNVINYSDAQLMLDDLQNIQAVGRLVVDLSAISVGIKQADLQLENQDILYIPATQQTIAVMGEVQNAATHRFKSGLTIDQYVSMSGGARKRADEDRMYVVKANGAVMLPGNSFWFNNEDNLQAGDTIIIPLDTEYKDNLSLWSQVTSIIYNTAVAFATISRI